MKMIKNMLTLGAALLACGGAWAESEETENTNARVDAKYQAEDLWNYPEAFYGRHFTARNGSGDAYRFMANYTGLPENYADPDVIITGRVKDYLKCSSMDFKSSRGEDEIYEGDSFKNCKTPSGKVFNGSVSCTGGFYWVTLYTADVPEADAEALENYDTDFMMTLAAQDAPSMEMPGEHLPGNLPRGYVLFPTFVYPLKDVYSYVAKTYINPATGRIFSYQIMPEKNLEGYDIKESLKEFCGKDYKQTPEKDGRFEVSNCMSRQWAKPIKVTGVVMKKKAAGGLVVTDFYSEGMPQDEAEFFASELGGRVKNLKPGDFEM